MSKKYDNHFKYKIIELVCNGKNASEVEREYKVARTTIMRWLRIFISDGPFNEEELTLEEKVNLEKLREKAKYRELELRVKGVSKNECFEWVLEFDKDLKQWSLLAEEWIKTQVRNKQMCLSSLSKFFKEYLITYNITRCVKDFLSKEYNAPNFFEISYAYFKNKNYAMNEARKTIEFIDWILLEKFSLEDDFGNKIIPDEFHNPLKKHLPDNQENSNLNQSNKNVLPYKFIKDLRLILCPNNAMHFKDWVFAQEATNSKNQFGSWFIVDESIIDKHDPDCVYRKRKTSKYERDKKGLPDMVYELWSPVVSVALLTKLFLPLRTYQVRMLDSGEMDTYKYIQDTITDPGKWIKNNSPLSEGDKNNPFEKGVLRKFVDPTCKIEMTGFFINTNKTADINKEEDKKGYEIPWQYEQAQYWLAKLRDWQQKYNPVTKPTPWTELTASHLGNSKDIKILKQMGCATFLFRNASSLEEKHLPIADGSINILWHKILNELEIKLNEISDGEKSIRFIKNEKTTFYPLHSLRVSLITAYALEGGVPMPILSKMVAGHARLIMTLYYTKPGISYVTDVMNQASQNILEKEKESFDRFLRDAKYEQLDNNIAINDPIALEAIIDAQQSGASIIIGDKGICPKGNFGCNCGGTFINDDTGTTTFGPVPGFPEQNCVRCRWFVTGPAFLPGLVHHFNTIGYNMSETAKRVIKFQDIIELLEDNKFDCENNNQIFTEHEKLSKYTNLYIQEIQKNDKLANDYNATLRLIDKCVKLAKNISSKESIQLVTVSSSDDIGFRIRNTESEFEQLQIICNGAEIFPETDASKAVLQRSQIIDLTLAENGKKPVMFRLTDEEQLVAGNQFMRIIMNKLESLNKMSELESFKEAVPYAIGRKKLEEIGLTNEFTEEFRSIKINEPALTLEQSAIINF